MLRQLQAPHRHAAKASCLHLPLISGQSCIRLPGI